MQVHAIEPEGSSPLARGLPHEEHAMTAMTRIIPARAGFTARGAPTASHGEDHPRSRGVYPCWFSYPIVFLGSSPLARGLQLALGVVVVGVRIIPARAGFTRPPSRPRAAPRDHPRSRGVYCSATCGRTETRGSSPLARGLRGRCPGGWRRAGIIPARAGFTTPPEWLASMSPDHPRSRGVYW